MNKHKSKYLYTASLMNQALLELLEKKDIEFITTTEITKKAGVNRSTFYLHYENIYDLLEETINNLNTEFVTSFTESISRETIKKDNAFLITNEFLVPYLNFCKKNKRILNLVHKKPQLFQSETVYNKMYSTIFYPAISQFIKEETKRIYYLEFYIQGALGIINKWIKLDCKTEIEELVAIIKDCIGYCVE